MTGNKREQYPAGTMVEDVLNAEVRRLRTENAALREIAQAVADGEIVHAEIVDAWTLLFTNHTLSYGQQIHDKARALLGE